MIQIILFLITFGTTYYTGEIMSDTSGLVYAGPLMLILLCHEGSHYVMCRLYDVKATPPNFIPAPPPPYSPFGTFGAVIVMKENLPSRKAIFDIGIAGPLGGFIVAVPCVLIGISLSEVVPEQQASGFWQLGEPLLLKLIVFFQFGSLEGKELMLHPMGYAGWIGMLVTAINLIPLGQLDGGHIAYAVFGRRSRWMFWPIVVGLLAMSYVLDSPAYLFFLALIIIFVGKNHPAPVDESAPLGLKRRFYALVALAMLVLSFIPVPISLSVPGNAA